MDENRGICNRWAFLTNFCWTIFRIGNGSSEVGSIKNLILVPKYINLPNANCVGALSGTLDSGYLFNVDVEGTTTDGKAIVVLGKNIVGGVVGRAIGNYKIYNINFLYFCECHI